MSRMQNYPEVTYYTSVDAPVSKKKTQERTDACAGSHQRRKTTKGRKSTYYGVKYPCTECGKFVGCDAAGKFNKHGWTRKAVYKGATSICSECGDEIQGIDYLCSACRA